MELGLLMRHDKVYGFFHEDNEAKPVVLIYSGERTAEFSTFSYLVDGSKPQNKPLVMSGFIINISN